MAVVKIHQRKWGKMRGSLKRCSQKMLQDVQHEPRLRWGSRHSSLLVQPPRCPRSRNETEMKYIKEKSKLEPFFSKPKIMLQRKKSTVSTELFNTTNVIFPGRFNIQIPGRFDPKFSSVLKMERELPEDQVTYCIALLLLLVLSLLLLLLLLLCDVYILTSLYTQHTSPK